MTAACWLCLDEGEINRMDLDEDEVVDCPACLRAEGIALRAECANKALEIERLRNALSEITTMDGEQARHTAECALRNNSALRESPNAGT